MSLTNALAIFENFKIRRIYDEQNEKWYFSVIDIIMVLTQQADYKKAKSYWSTLKERLNKEGNQSVTNCDQLKMPAADGKLYNTDAADVETLLRLVQSVPSPKAEPIKLWLARVGYERIQETSDPEISLNRARQNWQTRGMSNKWIQQRMTGQETRNKLTDYWKDHNVKEQDEFAILTNIIHKEWADLTVKEHKHLKGLKNQNLRDHMSEAELLFTALAELTTRQIAEDTNATGLTENKVAGKRGGKLAKKAKQQYEKETGRKVISSENYLPIQQTKKIK
ncbi:MAG: hypothetical protein LBQ47_01915 [Endomicrobium sp.]|jgi:hypothetical protein|nr:hypothetical protein [Endomicrobium sp.]